MLSTTTNRIPWKKSYVLLGFVIAAGAILLWDAWSHWRAAPDPPYFAYFLVAAMVSRLEIRLLRAASGTPVFCAFVLLGILEWSLPATLLLACTAAVVYFFAHTKERPEPGRVLFYVGSIAIATATSYYAYSRITWFNFSIDALIRLCFACLVFFAMSTFPAAAVTALRSHQSLRRLWRDVYFRSIPGYLLCAVAAELVSLVEHSIWHTALFVVPVLYLAYRSCRQSILRTESEKRHAEDMAALHWRIVEALALAIEAKDYCAHEHSRRVQVYAVAIGKELGLGKRDLEALRAAALLHDIGKLAAPEHILSKLTREEVGKMKAHAVVGAAILERVGFPYPVAPTVRAYHERWDGTGYPDGIRGAEIPIGARILAAVDALDDLAYDRQQRRALPLADALRRMAAEPGVRFDPNVIAALERRSVDLERLAREQASAAAAAIDPESRVAPELSAEATSLLAHIAAGGHPVQTLFELAQDIGTSLSLNETLSLLASRLKRMVPYDSLAIYVEREGSLRPEHVSGENFRLFSSLEIPLGQGLSGWVAQNRKPIMNGNPAVEPGYLNDETKFMTMRSALSVPLGGLSGTMSVLTLYHSEREAFTHDHLRILLAIAPKVGQSIENAMKYRQAESSAATDYLTGLPNSRSLFLHLDGELSRCRRSGEALAVLVCDMNGFKAVNDHYGHLEGNRVLREVAVKIQGCCREYDYVARMGGDEFVLVLPGLRMEQAQAKTLRLNALTKQAGQEVCGSDTLSLSVGVAVYPEDGKEADQLLSEADRRMYIAKQKEKQRLTEPRGYDFDAMMAG